MLDPVKVYQRDLAQFQSLPYKEQIRLHKRMKKGDIAARNQLVESVLPLLFRLAGQCRLKNFTFDDKVSLANEAVLDRIHLFDPTRGRISTFVTRVVFNRFYKQHTQYQLIRVPTMAHQYKHAEKAKKANEIVSLSPLHFNLSWHESPLDQMVQEEKTEVVQQALKKVPRKQRKYIVKHDLDGESWERIGKSERVSAMTIQRAVTKGRQQMKESLTEYVSV